MVHSGVQWCTVATTTALWPPTVAPEVPQTLVNVFPVVAPSVTLPGSSTVPRLVKTGAKKHRKVKNADLFVHSGPWHTQFLLHIQTEAGEMFPEHTAFDSTTF